MEERSPHVVMLAGPNGAGKTTLSRTLLAETLRLLTFVNADVIAQGLAGFDPDSAALEASRIMLDRMHKLVEQRADFGVETTLAGRTYAAWLRTLRETGYRVSLHYVWVESAELAIARVALRVQQGGHGIPEPTIRQRYRRSVQNFFALYRPIVDDWHVYDNTRSETPELFAFGGADGETVLNPVIWDQFQKAAEP